MFFRLPCLILICILSSCSNKNLRGEISISNDGETYLVFIKDCGSGNNIYVDGKLWNYDLNEKGIISPGEHKIICGGELSVSIKKGTTLHFDYWGP